MDATLKKYTFERGLVKSALTRFKGYLESFDNTVSIQQFQERFDRILPLFDKFDKIQNEIEFHVLDNATEQQTQQIEREQFENAYFDIVGTAREIIRASQQQNLQPQSNSPIPSSASSATKARVTLPTITLPSFDGSYEQWIRFRDTFTSLIHTNEALTNIDKFHYLNSAVKGCAARTIQAFGVTDTNYLHAWEALKHRFEDPKELKHHHIKAIFELQPLSKESHTGLQNLIDDFNNGMISLRALGEPTDKWDLVITYLLGTKLDSSTKREWEKKSMEITDTVTLTGMIDFLQGRCRYLANISQQETTKHTVRVVAPNMVNHRVKTHHTLAHVTTKPVVESGILSCPICKANHALYYCDTFLKMSHSARITELQKHQICFNCLKPGHQNKDCSRGSCRKCGKKHNTLLHRDNQTGYVNGSTQNVESHNPKDASNAREVKTFMAHNTDQTTLLSTALIDIKDRKGQKVVCRALLDSGSQSHFLSESMMRKLDLPCTPTNVKVLGIGQHTHGIQRATKIELFSRYNGYKASIPCLVLPKITENVPSMSFPITGIPLPPGIKLADPEFNKSKGIDMIIGAGLFWELQCIGRHSLGSRYPILQKTQLGWIVAGNIHHTPTKQPSHTQCHIMTNDALNQQLEKFWNIENCIKDTSSHSSSSTDICEQEYQSNVTHDKTGRYIVRIPFNDKLKNLGDSRQQAIRRLFSLERKLGRLPDVRQEYNKFMTEYETLGHMTEINQNQDCKSTPYYLPHHAVFKESSTTTKLRVVFDGSAKTTTGISLNDTQRIGPTVQEELFAIVVRFRKHRYVLSADISKMYRQILVHPNDRHLQRILWRSDPSSTIKEYELNTITYGTASAPFLATRTLIHIGQTHMLQRPAASETIIHDFYVDDLLTGTDSIKQARQLKTDVTNILATAGMELRKWASNDTRILTDTRSTHDQIEIKADKDPKTLGLIWDSEHDELRYCVQKSKARQITKRTILSEIAQIFDPLGLIGPATIQAKIILQRLWQLQVSWDESLPQDIHTQWSSFRRELDYINSIRIPRYTLQEGPRIVELHGFCDASEKAYGTCIYLRSVGKDGKCMSQLLCAKSRVAPLKTISLPRLELCGALLLAQLITKIRKALKMTSCQEYYWCDSMITLAWIKAPPNRWKTFVANRTSEIQQHTSENWNYVASQENPADIISRGVNPSTLLTCPLWWNGPSWLTENTDKWPSTEEQLPQNLPEERSHLSQVFTTTIKDFNLFDRFSTYTKLLRVTSYIFRFIQNTRTKTGIKTTGSLSAAEIKNARNRLARIAQEEMFNQEIDALKARKPIPRSSKLQSLNPFVDETGLIRVGGRLKNAPIPYHHKHPIVLPSKHKLTTLLIRHEHQRLLHAGCQAVIASIRTEYWPLSCTRTVKGVIRKCVRCFRARPMGLNPMMGDLPATRVTPARPFYTCGVDYAGPFFVKDRTRSKTASKAYLCVFVCFATRAVHLELAIDLTTEAFLNCLRRFIARRGVCRKIFSDNGTNFIGARNDLASLRSLLTDKRHNNRISDELASNQIQWHMIPPHAPHFGGLWEGAVKSTKYHLKRIIGETKLTYEELYTLLAQVEACLNSRPLLPISDDPNDLVPLTPGHFLIGDSLTAVPEVDLRDVKENRLTRYQHVQYMLQHFWSRWQKEYLHQLQQRNKWRVSTSSKFGVGTLVVLKEDNLPPLRWRLGRIVDIHPGSDGITRVVSVKASDGIIKRPVAKICLLPIEDEVVADTTTSAPALSDP